jgi:hypothetical protein
MDTLEANDMKSNPHDTCVMNKVCSDGAQLTVAVYVDDVIMSSTNTAEMERLLAAIKKRYGEVKSTRTQILEFLGMSIDMSEEGSAKITMSGTEERILKEAQLGESKRKMSSPAADNLFDVDESSPALPERERKIFHRLVARLLYLAKRCRPECLLAVSFLTTRVTKATEEDRVKLNRLISYLRDAPNRGIRLTPGKGGVHANGYIDAAYGVHEDGKSHTGACITIGEAGPVLSDSSRQSIVTKSSTEAELVGMSDSANQILHLRNFLVAQGYDHGPATVYQDNMSCISMIEKGRSTSKRSRHIAIRHFWMKERIDTEEIKVVHRPTELMGAANVMTKPTHGAQFTEERMQLTNWM